MKKNLIGLLTLFSLIVSGCNQQVTNSSSGSNVLSSDTDTDSSVSSTETESSSNSSSEIPSDELQAISISEFLTKKDALVYYQLTGKVTKITNTQYGNFNLQDATGEIYVWGLLPEKGSSNKTAFSSLGIQVGDTITIAGRYQQYNGTDEVVDAYFISKSSNSTAYLYDDFTAEEKKEYQDLFGFVIPFMATNEYYLYAYNEDGYQGITYYTYENQLSDFTNYLEEFAIFHYDDTVTDSDGDLVYYYSQGDTYIDICFYYAAAYSCYVLYVDVYFETSTDGGDISGEDVELITNANKGLPTSENGIYNVDFTKAEYVKNVTEQASYLDGCPTTGNPKVLVIPVEFSDVTAASKGYTTDAIEKAFCGTSAELQYYSVKEYYTLSSYGQLNLDITVLDQWYRPQNPSTYYQNATIDYFGYQYDAGEQLVMDEILQQLSTTMDLSEFDSDQNGIIDSIVLVNTLDIDATAESSFNWAFRFWNLYTDSNGYYYEYDEVSANDYLWASYQFLFETTDADGNVSYDGDTPDNTYTFIHEFGHILGADDYYDTTYTSSPLGGADIMDGMSGDHNPYTKFNYGWLTQSRLVVADDEITLDLAAFEENGDTIIIANNWDDALGIYQEYYVIMYYTNTSLNGKEGAGYFSRDGIVVYHINASLYSMEYDGELYYDVYNNNTDSSDEYGTEDNLIEFVKTEADTYTYIVGDSLSDNLIDSQGNKISYTFTVNSLSATTASLTFRKIG